MKSVTRGRAGENSSENMRNEDISESGEETARAAGRH